MPRCGLFALYRTWYSWASWICCVVAILNFGKFFATISLNISSALVSLSSPSSIPSICTLHFFYIVAPFSVVSSDFSFCSSDWGFSIALSSRPLILSSAFWVHRWIYRKYSFLVHIFLFLAFLFIFRDTLHTLLICSSILYTLFISTLDILIIVILYSLSDHSNICIMSESGSDDFFVS